MKSTKGTRTLTIGELSVNIVAAGLGGATVDTAAAADFEVEVIYSFHKGWKGTFGGRMEDCEDGEPDSIEAHHILTTSALHFEGNRFNSTAHRGVDIIDLFTGAQVTALEDRIYKLIQEESHDA